MRRFGLPLLVLSLVATALATAPARADPIVTPPAIDFGNVLIGTTATRLLELVAEPGFTIEGAGGSGINVPFSLVFGTHNADFTHFEAFESFTPIAPGLATGTLGIIECPPLGHCPFTEVPVRGIGVSSLAIPEPPGLLLLATGAALLMRVARRRRPLERR